MLALWHPNAWPLREDEDDDERCYGKVACIRIERQGEFGSGPDMSRTQTRLPLRPSTNMSHTTYVKHGLHTLATLPGTQTIGTGIRPVQAS